MRLTIVGVCAVLMTVTAGVPAGAGSPRLTRVQNDSADYRYCYVAKSPYGEIVYFSEAFRAERGTYSVGIENAFNSFVTGRYDSQVISGAVCMYRLRHVSPPGAGGYRGHVPKRVHVPFPS